MTLLSRIPKTVTSTRVWFKTESFPVLNDYLTGAFHCKRTILPLRNNNRKTGVNVVGLVNRF